MLNFDLARDRFLRGVALACWLACSMPSVAALFESNPVVPKWKRFEQSFNSTLNYSNPLQDVTLKIVFISPVGQTNIVDGFWDGSKIWRVRFTPNEVGQWTFRSVCSDPTNRGLHLRQGKFLCTPAIGENPFGLHGPVRVGRDRRHLEHADGQPFFWLADSAWDGAVLSDKKEWEFYVGVRGRQGFTVAQWSAIPDPGVGKQTAFSGPTSQIVLHPEFFKRLDAKIEALSRAGILSAIAPLPDQPNDNPLPDDQAALLLRYLIARWGADPVAWVLPLDNSTRTNNASRWKRVGQAVFGDVPHAPVVMYAGQNAALLDEFRDQYWIGIFSFQPIGDVTDDALKLAFTGAWSNEWQKQPSRPLIPFVPLENSVSAQSGKHFTANDVRQAAYWSLLMTPPAGIAYGAAGVADWDTRTDSPTPRGKPPPLAMWQKALFLPGAKQMMHVRSWADSFESWRLQPDSRIVAGQPGAQTPHLFVAAAASAEKDLVAVYIPDGGILEVLVPALPASPATAWLNPRDGKRSQAIAVVGDATCQFPTPGPGDWLLLLTAGGNVK